MLLEIELEYNELPHKFEVEFNPPRDAPKCSDPNDPRFSDPGDGGSLTITKVWIQWSEYASDYTEVFKRFALEHNEDQNLLDRLYDKALVLSKEE